MYMMNITEEKGSNPPSSCPATATPLVLFFESSPGRPEEDSSPFKGSTQCEGCPEFAFTTSYDEENLFADVDVDLLNCFSSAGNNNNSNNSNSSSNAAVAGEVSGTADHDDLFSAYIDEKRLDEMKGMNNSLAPGVLFQQEDNHRNGGGFVVETNVGGGGGVRFCGGKRKRKERSNKNAMMKSCPTMKKRQRRSPRSFLTTAEAAENWLVEPRKAMAEEELAKLWSIDPKRAKRIVANRHSAARSKERKAQYILDLEENVKQLNSEVAFLNTRLIANQKETSELAAEKTELKRQLRSLECQAEQVDAEIEAMKQDIEWLRSATGETDSYQTEQLQPQYFQLHPPPPSTNHNKRSPPQLHCQQSMLLPYLNVANSQPLF